MFLNILEDHVKRDKTLYFVTLSPYKKTELFVPNLLFGLVHCHNILPLKACNIHTYKIANDQLRNVLVLRVQIKQHRFFLASYFCSFLLAFSSVMSQKKIAIAKID